MRDSYRQREYDAEAAVERRLGVRRLDSLEECQELVDRALARRGLDMRVTVKKGQRNSAARMRLGERTILIGFGMTNELTVLHEVTHHVAGLGKGHGWEFCRTLLEVLQEEGLWLLAADLKAEYERRGVPHVNPALQRHVTAAKRRPDVSDVPNERGTFIIAHDRYPQLVRWVERRYDRVAVPWTWYESQAMTWRTRRGAERVASELREAGYAVHVERVD